MKKDIIQDIEAERIKTKTLPKEIDNIVNSIIFKNMIIAIIIMIYTYFLVMGFVNISSEKYIIDLMVFSILLLFLSIIIFEIAYKKDSGKLAINGIEVLVLAIVTFYLPYMYAYFHNDYNTIVILLGIVYAIYYSTKSIISTKLEKRKYKKTSSDIKNITNVNDDEIIKYNKEKIEKEKKERKAKKTTEKPKETKSKKATSKKSTSKKETKK